MRANDSKIRILLTSNIFLDGITVGIVALGSSGEAVHLSHDERREVLLAARQVLDSDASLAAIPLIAGTPASSTRETIELTRQAAECGADSAMVIAPGGSAFLRGRFLDVVSFADPPASCRLLCRHPHPRCDQAVLHGCGGSQSDPNPRLQLPWSVRRYRH